MPKITEEELTAILDQIIIDVENLDYTAIYEMIEKLADLDSVIVTPLLTGFLSESHRKAEGNAKDDLSELNKIKDMKLKIKRRMHAKHS
tara:strand:+ start:275 stop:541 length:267 start_codon:yes stop_codon:yes gene_type:complete